VSDKSTPNSSDQVSASTPAPAKPSAPAVTPPPLQTFRKSEDLGDLRK
jgi:hypothetical protein